MTEIKKIKGFLEKEKCECNKIATWWYAPGYSGKDKDHPYYCDDCVPRDCSCEWTYVSKDAYGPIPLDQDCLPEGIEGKDWKWIEKEGTEEVEEIKKGEVWVTVDEKGRQYPCVEYCHNKDGWDKD